MTGPTGARSATGRHHSGLRWLPWLALLVLAAVIAVVVLIVANVQDGDSTAARNAGIGLTLAQPTAVA